MDNTLYLFQEFHQGKKFNQLNAMIINMISKFEYKNLKISLIINSKCLQKIRINLIQIIMDNFEIMNNDSYIHCLLILNSYGYSLNFLDEKNKNILHYCFNFQTEKSSKNFHDLLIYCVNYYPYLFNQSDIDGKLPFEYGIIYLNDSIWNIIGNLDIPLIKDVKKIRNLYHQIIMMEDERKCYNIICEILSSSNKKKHFFKQKFIKPLIQILVEKSFWSVFDIIIPYENPQFLIPYLHYLIQFRRLEFLPLWNEEFMIIFLHYCDEIINPKIQPNYDSAELDESLELRKFLVSKVLYLSSTLVNLVYKVCHHSYIEFQNLYDLETAKNKKWIFVIFQQCRFHQNWSDIIPFIEQVLPLMTIFEIISFCKSYPQMIKLVIGKLDFTVIRRILYFLSQNNHIYTDEYFFIIEQIYRIHKNDAVIMYMISLKIGHIFVRRYIEDGNTHILQYIRDNENYRSIYTVFFYNYKKVKCPICRENNHVNIGIPCIKGVETRCCICFENSADIIYPQCLHINTCLKCVKLM